MTDIEYNSYSGSAEAKFSILIPTWNNLGYVRLCVDSLRKNSKFPHQIILHINDGRDGTREWAVAEKLDHTRSADNIGICYAVNAAAQLAKTDYIVYMNDDMYACPHWDKHLFNEINALDHNRFFFSSTMIEPGESGNACVISCADFGDSLETFHEQRLLERFAAFEKADWQGATWPPNIVHRDIWKLVGGYSVEFSPGMYSDPDFSRKLWQAGVRLFKGVSQSRVFHFQCKTTGKVKKNDGRKQFREKWQLTSSKFMKYYLKSGQKFKGPIDEPEETLALKWARLRANLPF